MLKIGTEDVDRDDLTSTVLDELVTEGARCLLLAALEAEVADYIDRHQEMLDAESGRRLVVRNGKAEERTLVTGAGGLKIRAPRVHDKREGHGFSSSILPRYARRSPKVADVLPVLYLRGVSTGDFAPALEEFFGTDAGLSASYSVDQVSMRRVIVEAFEDRDLTESDFVYVWVDGVHFRIRLEEDRLCCLVIVEVRSDGTKELIACADGYRESTESWAEVLRDLKARGMTAPVVAVGDGALGFWAALGDVFPETREQRCWVHKSANILEALPKRLRKSAKAALHEIYNAETRRDAEAGIDTFARQFGDKYPKAVEKLTKDREALLTFYDYPAAHWVHLRTVNPIESTFATVRLRTKVTKGAGARRRGLVMAYKLLDAAQARWRRINSPELVALVRAGVEFKDGTQTERRKDQSRDAAYQPTPIHRIWRYLWWNYLGSLSSTEPEMPGHLCCGLHQCIRNKRYPIHTQAARWCRDTECCLNSALEKRNGNTPTAGFVFSVINGVPAVRDLGQPGHEHFPIDDCAVR